MSQADLGTCQNLPPSLHFYPSPLSLSSQLPACHLSKLPSHHLPHPFFYPSSTLSTKPPLNWTIWHFSTASSTTTHLFCLCSLGVLAFPGVNQACPLQPLPFHLQQTLTFPDTHRRAESRSTVLPPSIAPSFSSLPHIPVLCCNILLLPVSLNMPNT